MNRFKDKVVLVTGGNRNTGLWLVKKFVDEGAKVFTCARNEKSAADGVASLEKLLGPGMVLSSQPLATSPSRPVTSGTPVRMIICDISDKSQVDAMFDVYRKRGGTFGHSGQQRCESGTWSWRSAGDGSREVP